MVSGRGLSETGDVTRDRAHRRISLTIVPDPFQVNAPVCLSRNCSVLARETPSTPVDTRFRRPLRNLPDEAMSGVVNDTTLAKPPPLWIPAFAGMTVVQRSPFAGITGAVRFSNSSPSLNIQPQPPVLVPCARRVHALLRVVHAADGISNPCGGSKRRSSSTRREV